MHASKTPERLHLPHGRDLTKISITLRNAIAVSESTVLNLIAVQNVPMVRNGERPRVSKGLPQRPAHGRGVGPPAPSATMFSNPPALRDAAAAVALVAAFGACALATVTDVTSRRIPNIACIVVLAGGGAWALAATRSGTTLISLAVAGGLLAWGTWMHSAKVLGGGDVKMLVAITAWLPLDTLSTFVLWGGLGSLLTAGFVRLIGWIQKTPTGPEGASVPMGLAFFCGMLADRPSLGQRIALLAKNIGVFFLMAGIVFFGSRTLRGSLWGTTSDTKVLVASRDLTSGEILTASDFTWDIAKVPAGVEPVRSDRKEPVIGAVVTTDIASASVVPQSSLIAIGRGHSLAAAVAAGRSAMTIPPDRLGSATESLAPGDRVDVLLTTETRKLRQGAGITGPMSNSLSTVLLVHEARVLQVGAAPRRENRKSGMRAVTLDVSPDDAQKVALAMATGTLHVVAHNGANLPDGMRITSLNEIMPVAAEASADARPAKPKITVVSGSKTTVVEIRVASAQEAQAAEPPRPRTNARPTNAQAQRAPRNAPAPVQILPPISSTAAAPVASGDVGTTPIPAPPKRALVVPLRLSVNEARIVRFATPIQTVVVGNPEIASIDIRSTTTMLIVGKKAGRTTLLGLGEDDVVIQTSDITVSHDTPSMLDSLRAALPQNTIALKSTETGIIMTGSVADTEESALATRIVAQFIGEPTRVINRLRFTAPDQVQLRVRIAEVQRTALRDLGINWQALGLLGPNTLSAAVGSTTRAGTVPPASTSSTFGSLAARFPGNPLSFTGVLDILESKGLATVLAQPSLTAMSGQSASFLAGGEIPVPVPISSSTTSQIGLQWKEYGVRLSFTPTILPGGRIGLKVNPEVSSLDPANGVQYNGYTVPAIATRRAETSVELGSGDSFVIAGLLSEENARTLSQLPGIGNVPVLGDLTRSTKFQRRETELLIVVTPFLAGATTGAVPLPTDAFVRSTAQPESNRPWDQRAMSLPRTLLLLLTTALPLAGCIEPMTMDLPRSDTTRIRERTSYAVLDFVPGTSQLQPDSQQRLAAEVDLAAADRGSQLRLALGTDPLASARSRTLARAIQRPNPPAERAQRWGIQSAPNVDPDTALLTVVRAALPEGACTVSPGLSPEMREAVGQTSCAVITALDMNVVNPRDLIEANAPPAAVAGAVSAQPSKPGSASARAAQRQPRQSTARSGSGSGYSRSSRTAQ
eukprot:gene10840-10920_t